MHYLRQSLMSLCVIAVAIALAAPAQGQCPSSYVDTSPDNLTGLNGRELNEYAMLLQAARMPSCKVEAYNQLKNKLNYVRLNAPSTYWKTWLAGAYVSFIMAAGMELGGINGYDELLDTELQFVATQYSAVETGSAPPFSPDPCGLAGTDLTSYSGWTNENYNKPFWRRANSCMDDHTINASGHAWVAAWQRLSGRSYTTRRNQAIDSIHKALRTSDSICVHDKAKYETDSSNRTVETNPCNATISQLGNSGIELVSLNHGNQAPNYGFGLLSSVASAMLALDLSFVPIDINTTFSADEKKILKYLWAEAAAHTTSTGDFFSRWVGGENCYNMAGVLATGQRVLTTGWGCEDQQFVHGDCSESTNPSCTEGGATGDEYTPPFGYKAKYYPLQRFYDRYGFEKGTGGGFAFNVFSEVQTPTGLDSTFITLEDIGDKPEYDLARILGEFYGVGRHETYRELAWNWLQSAPPLTAGSEFRVGIRTSGGYYFAATSGGGSTLYATATAKTDANAKLYFYDLNGAHMRSGDPVAVAIKSGSTRYYMRAVNGGGGEVRMDTLLTNNDPLNASSSERFTIQKLSGSPDTILNNGDTFALVANNGQYVVAEYAGGGAINANRSAIGPWETFTWDKID
jgi:hypothetical protein